MRKKIFLSLILVIILLVGYGISQLPHQVDFQNRAGKIQVVASFYPLYFFTTQITGDKAIVYNITPSGAEPHDYEPTAQDIAHITDSQLLILNGGKIEAWGDSIKNTLVGTPTKIISVGDSLFNQTLVEASGKNSLDPHIWTDPALAIKEVEIITNELILVDPINTAFYQKNSSVLIEKLKTLDNNFRQGLQHCAKKDIVTSHASLGYLAKEYGLNQISISGLSPDTEPSPRQMTEVIDFVKKNSVSYIFFESLVSPKLSETIASETGAKTMVLNPLEGLTNEEMSAGKTYFTEMQNNLTNLRTALQCQ